MIGSMAGNYYNEADSLVPIIRMQYCMYLGYLIAESLFWAYTVLTRNYAPPFCWLGFRYKYGGGGGGGLIIEYV